MQQLTQAFSDYNHGINVSALLTEYVENCSRLITDAQIILYKLPVSLLHKETLNLLFGGYNL